MSARTTIQASARSADPGRRAAPGPAGGSADPGRAAPGPAGGSADPGRSAAPGPAGGAAGTAAGAAGPPVTPAIYECLIAHSRKAPLRNSFSYRTYQWLVDLDQLPLQRPWLRPLAGFRAADHLGDPRRSIRGNVERFLAGRGIDLAGGRILMLAHARVLGYVFNPLTVFWCHRPDGALECVLAEVHNTYGQRHCYLLRTDSRGRAQVAKEFYVSPFYPVDGTYEMTLPEPGSRLALTVVLSRPDGHSFTASVRGLRAGTGGVALLRAAVRHPFSTAAVSGRIHWQGIRLYARGLRPAPRPPNSPQEPHCPQEPHRPQEPPSPQEPHSPQEPKETRP